jgi:hypothetical protein
VTFWQSLYVHAFPGIFMLWLAVSYRLYLWAKNWRPPMSKEEKEKLFAALTRRSFVGDTWKNLNQ